MDDPNQTSHSAIVSISPVRLVRRLTGIALGLVVISWLGLCLRLYADYATLHRYIHHVVDKTSVDAELTIPTFFSVLLLLFASVLLWFISSVKASTRFLRRRWAVLSLIFVGLAFDEGTSFHEFLNLTTLRAYAPDSKYLRWTWVIPYGLFTGLVFVWYLPFLRVLPRRTALLFLLAGALYVGGAIGVEMIGAAVSTQSGFLTYSYQLTSHLEELCEMLGVIVFIYGLLDYVLAAQWLIRIEPTQVSSVPVKR